MPDLNAPDYTIARLVIERGLALTYLIAFVVAARQFPALCGDRGLQPASRILARARFLDEPSIFHLAYSDRRLASASWTGFVIGLLLLVSLPRGVPLPVTIPACVGL